MLLGTLCLCPLPGIGTVVGAAIFAMALMSWRGAGEMNLPSRFGGYGLSRARALRVLRTLARFHELAARTHRPRLQALVDRLPNRVMAGAVALMGAVIALPIPLGSVLPGLTLVCAGMSLLRRCRHRTDLDIVAKRPLTVMPPGRTGRQTARSKLRLS